MCNKIYRFEHVVRVTGEIDISNSNELFDELTDAVSAYPQGIILDIAGVNYIDSQTVKIILNICNSLNLTGGKLVMIINTPIVIRILDLIGLDCLPNIIICKVSDSEKNNTDRNNCFSSYIKAT
ncbi:MAG: STAS domain-containing protein [Armatimonadota bacterium]